MSRRRLGPPTRLRPADAISEAVTSIVARPARAVITCLGTLLGVAWFVTALGLASTANGHVTAAFARHLPTHVLISPKSTGPAPAASPYPIDVERRLDALAGVVASGVFWPVRPGHPAVVSAVPQARQAAVLSPAGTSSRRDSWLPRGRGRPGKPGADIRRMGSGTSCAGLRRWRRSGEGDGHQRPAATACHLRRQRALRRDRDHEPRKRAPVHLAVRSCCRPRPPPRSGVRLTRTLAAIPDVLIKTRPGAADGGCPSGAVCDQPDQAASLPGAGAARPAAAARSGGGHANQHVL